MKTEHITKRLREKARSGCPPKFPYERMIEWIAADALDAQAREIESMRRFLEYAYPAREGFGEDFPALVKLGLLVQVPADDRHRKEWGDEPTMWVWRWHPLVVSTTPEES